MEVENKEPERNIAARFLVGLATCAYYHSVAVIIISVLIGLLCAWYGGNYLYFDSDRANLISRSASLQARQDRYIENFPAAEELVVIVESGSEEQRKSFVDTLADKLRREPEIFSFVFEKTEISFLQTHLLQYLEPEDLAQVAQGIEGNLSLFQTLAQAHRLPELLLHLQSVGLNGSEPRQIEPLLPVINDFVKLFHESMTTRGHYTYVSPWRSALMDRAAGDAKNAPRISELPKDLMRPGTISFYNTVAGGKLYLLVCRPTYSAKEDRVESIQRAVARLRVILAQMNRSNREVLVSLTGELVLDMDEAEASTSDSTNSSICSVVLVALLFAWAFREVYRPMLAIFTLMIGICWTMGFATLAIGHLNLITVTFATILVGLGVDFGVHFIYRYDEEKFLGHDSLEAMQITLAGAGAENLTGAVSTAFAFLALNLTGDSGISELGNIAGAGMLLCFLAMALLLPALLFELERFKALVNNGNACHDQGLNKERVSNLDKKALPAAVCASVQRFAWLARLEKATLSNPVLVIILCTLFTGWCLYQGRTVHYDYNLLNLQAANLDSVKAEMHLINSSDYSLLQAISLCQTPEEAERLTKAYEKLPTVAKVECVAAMIPKDYAKKKKYLHKITSLMSRIVLTPMVGNEAGPGSTKNNGTNGTNNMLSANDLRAMGASFEKVNEAVEKNLGELLKASDPELRQEAKSLKQSIGELFTTLSGMGPGPIEDGLSKFEADFFEDFHGVFRFLKMQVDGPELTLKDLPNALMKREIGKKGYIQVRVFPKGNIWERGPQERFVQSVEAVDPNVIGMPVVTYYDTESLRLANAKAGVYALIAIWFLLLVHFRRIKTALLAAFPKVVGIIWMVGAMGYLGVNFNSANFLALPLILGIGLVFGIHVVHRIAEEGPGGIFGHSTGPAIALSAATTIAGFGTLIFASHQGISSLGIVMTLGVGANLLTSIVYLPALLVWLERHGLGVAK